jgi:hypothetical protein
MKALEATHDSAFIKSVLAGNCGQWSGTKPIMGQTAYVMFKGTIRAVELILAGAAKVVFNPQGAKHHAQHGWSEGFCVFNDFAWAAKEFVKNGLKVVYIDWDVNAGDGVQNLLADTDIPTFSIHGHGIYPTHSDTWIREAGTDGNYVYQNEYNHWYNYCLQQGEGDEAFNKKLCLDRAGSVVEFLKTLIPGASITASKETNIQPLESTEDLKTWRKVTLNVTGTLSSVEPASDVIQYVAQNKAIAADRYNLYQITLSFYAVLDTENA